ncbi:GNAT family N-acetyltransferase [Pedobacter arcticus]|uniref:GNAT family N-acetyltransferase n=1 Tax=Pedobacter arcticus TaxID=752140 RepID=UPI0003712ECB|nr:GNAT family N-acetyltransferase [Pedobacter arcticus]
MIEHLKIRQYQLEDKEILLDILKLNVPNYFAPSEIDDLESYLDNEIEHYFVAELNSKIVGAGGINFENNYTIGKISWDFIAPDFQGKGIGQKLLAHRINFLKSIPSVENVLVRTSQHAYKFYEKNGFVLKEFQKDYWAPGFDLYKMVI